MEENNKYVEDIECGNIEMNSDTDTNINTIYPNANVRVEKEQKFGKLNKILN